MTPPSALALPHVASIIGRLPTSVLVVDALGQVLYANRGPHGEAHDALDGRNVYELFAHEHAERLRVALARTHEGATDTFELGEHGAGGTKAWWRADVSPLEADAALVLLTDLTSHKREEERLRRAETLLVDTQGIAHMGTWEWDITEPTAKWSAELYRIYGLTPEEYTPSYEAYLEKVHPDDRERVRRVTEACFKEHKPYSHDERIFRKDGEMRWLHTWAVPVLGEDGQLVRLLGVCQDVTDTKRAESAMRAQMMTRGLARRLLQDLSRRANVPEQTVRELGRGLAREHKGPDASPQAYVAAFSDMGFGDLHYEGVVGERFGFSATDLLEHTPDSALPTCFLTLGYLEGVVSAITGRPALGSEMRCQSLGHEACRFVVQ
jgi:PAS domain S-box-containing protein